MKKILMNVLSSLFVLIITACNSTSGLVVPTPASSSTPQAAKSLPTAISPSQTIVYDDLLVMMNKAEITTSYLTEYGSNRKPPAGKRIIWIHILLKNIGQDERDLPAPEHFIVLNGTTEYKSIYGHRKDYADYMALTPILVQGQEADAWLRFDIPANLELRICGLLFYLKVHRLALIFRPTIIPGQTTRSTCGLASKKRRLGELQNNLSSPKSALNLGEDEPNCRAIFLPV